MVTKLSEDERKSLIERFQQRLVEDIPLDQKAIRDKLAASAPRLPDDPTPEQLDAWVELTELMSDPSFAESMRVHTREVWTRGLDMPGLQQLNLEIGEAARLAQDAGTAPESAGGRALVDRYLNGLAKLSGQRAEDPKFRAGVRQHFDRQDPRETRYWQLVSMLNDSKPFQSMLVGWRFVVSALRHHLPAA